MDGLVEPLAREESLCRQGNRAIPSLSRPMRPLSASECVTPAIERTKSLLFRPFQWKMFLKLTAVAFFAEIGGSLSFSTPGHQSSIPGISPAAQAMVFAVLLGVALVGLVIGLALLYLGSRLQLVLLEVVVTRQTLIAPIWRRYTRLTWRWLGLKILLFLVLALVLGAMLLPVVLSMVKNMPSGAQTPSAMLFSHILLFIGAIFLAIVVFLALYFLVRDFALPFLALENLSITEALGRLRILIAAAPGEIALYLLLRFLLGLVAAIGAEMIILLVLLVSLIPFGIVGGVLWLTLHHAGTAGTAALIAAAIVGGLVFALWMACVCIGLLGTVFVFTQCYAVYFLGGRYPLLGNILEPPPLPPVAPPSHATSYDGPPLPADPSLA
jgi:hypothetical protein